MGCRASKTVSQEERTMPTLGPFLRRRLRQIRKLKSASKEHYRHIRSDDEVNDRMNVSFGSAEGSAKVVPVPLEPEEMNSRDKEMEEEVLAVVMAGIENAVLEEENERISGANGVRLCPSPSFRIYVKEKIEGKEDEDDTQIQDLENDAEKEDDTKIEDLEEVVIIEHLDSTKVIVKEKQKKRTLSKVISKGNPVRNLLKVKSCYYPSCVCSSRNSRIIAAN